MSVSTVIASFYIFLYIFMEVACDIPSPTIVHRDNNCQEDAEKIYHATAGRWGTDEKTLIETLTGRTSRQRKEIVDAYASIVFDGHQRNMRKDIEADTSGTFQDLLLDLTYSLEEFLAREVHKSLEHQKNDHAYIEILCTCDKDLMNGIRAAYFEVFQVSLSQEIENRIQDVPTRMFLLRIIGGFELPPRSLEEFNEHAVHDQLKYIPEDEGKCTIDENGKLFSFLVKESFKQIRTVVKQFDDNHNDDPVVKKIEDNCKDGLLKKVYTTIVSYAVNPARFYAQRLKDSMDGIGTKEELLNRILIWRSEIDLKAVEQAFQELTHQSLLSWVKGDSSGDYEHTLVKLVEGNVNQE